MPPKKAAGKKAAKKKVEKQIEDKVRAGMAPEQHSVDGFRVHGEAHRAMRQCDTHQTRLVVRRGGVGGARRARYQPNGLQEQASRRELAAHVARAPPPPPLPSPPRLVVRVCGSLNACVRCLICNWTLLACADLWLEEQEEEQEGAAIRGTGGEDGHRWRPQA